MTAGSMAEGFDPNVIALTFDVEWASQPVIDDVRALLDERGLRGTFFVTHANVETGSHERGLHPNFRRNGDIYRLLANAGDYSDNDVYEHVLRTALSFAPEALGTRSHSLFFDSSLLPIYAKLGLQYDSTLRLELVPHLVPFLKQYGILEIPAYYADYDDIVTQRTGFLLPALALDAPGMKVFDFHPNLIYANVCDLASYDAIRPIYRDSDRLLNRRPAGSGTRALFIALLDEIVSNERPTATLAEICSCVSRALVQPCADHS